MGKSEFLSVILEFFNEDVEEFRYYGSYEVTLKLKDVDLQINKVNWEQAIVKNI